MQIGLSEVTTAAALEEKQKLQRRTPLPICLSSRRSCFCAIDIPMFLAPIVFPAVWLLPGL
jgi:hypothetical protein